MLYADIEEVFDSNIDDIESSSEVQDTVLAKPRRKNKSFREEILQAALDDVKNCSNCGEISRKYEISVRTLQKTAANGCLPKKRGRKAYLSPEAERILTSSLRSASNIQDKKPRSAERWKSWSGIKTEKMPQDAEPCQKRVCLQPLFSAPSRPGRASKTQAKVSLKEVCKSLRK